MIKNIKNYTIFLTLVICVLLASINYVYADEEQPITIIGGENMTIMHNENTANAAKMTIGSLINADDAKYDTWYFVDTDPMSINLDLDNPDFPLKEGKKAVIVNPEFYIFSRTRADTVFAFYVKQHKTQKGEVPVIYRKVYISHWRKQIPLDEEILKKLRIPTETAGMYLFKLDANKQPIAIEPSDAVFIRKYYRISVDSQKDAEQRIVCEAIRPLVAEYIIYDYYPDGKMQRKVEIVESGILGPRPGKDKVDFFADDRDSHIKYLIYVSNFTESGKQLSGPGDDKETTLTDPKSPLWVQNILHD